MQSSGLVDLATTLTQVCVADGARTRAVSRYLGLRKTESQFRGALTQLDAGLKQVLLKYEIDRKNTRDKFQKELDQLINWLSPLVERETGQVVSRISGIALKDDRLSAFQIMGIDQMVANLRLEVDARFIKTIRPELLRYVENIEPYRLPRFDAEGEHSGDKCAINLDIPTPHIPDLNLWFSINLEDEIFERVRLLIKEKWGSFFSKKMEQEAQSELESLTRQRRNYVRAEFVKQWGSCFASWGEKLDEQVASLYAPLFEEFDRIIERISCYENEPIADTRKRIKVALSNRGSKVAIQQRLIAGFKLKPKLKQ